MSLADPLSVQRPALSLPPLGRSLALLILLTAFGWAVAPAAFTGFDPLVGEAAAKLTAPGAAHWLGTDELGRDVLARLIHGARATLAASAIAVLTGLTVGSLIGLLAGSVGGWVETVLMRLVDVLLAIPALLLSLSLIVILGFGNYQAALAVGATAIAGFARLIWAEVVTIRRSDYVEAAFGSGGRFLAVLWRHVLPFRFT